MLVSLCNLHAMGKIQKNIQTTVRPAGPIILGIRKTPPFMKVAYIG